MERYGAAAVLGGRILTHNEMLRMTTLDNVYKTVQEVQRLARLEKRRGALSVRHLCHKLAAGQQDGLSEAGRGIVNYLLDNGLI